MSIKYQVSSIKTRGVAFLTKGGMFICLLFGIQNGFSQSAVSVTPNKEGYEKIDSFYRSLSIDLDQSKKPELYYEIYHWYRTRYCYGGNSKSGIDCSHFVNTLYEKVYDNKLSTSAPAIFEQCRVLKKGIAKAKEGDLVFFKIKKNSITHVGIYLQNGKFAHATTQAGVIISALDEPYYRKYFYKVGRVR